MTPKKFLAICLTFVSCIVSAQNIRHIRKLEAQLDTLNDSEKWSVLAELASEYASIDSAKAWNYYSQAFTGDTANPEKEFERLLTLGFLQEGLQQPDSAKAYHLLAIAVAERLNNTNQITEGLQNLARINMLQGSTRESIQQSKEAIRIASENRDSIALVGLYTNVAYAYHTLTNYDSALVFYLQGANLCELHPVYECAKLYNNMGITYQSEGEFDKAEIYNYKALYIRGEARDSLGVAASYSNIAGTHWFRQQIDSATYYTQKAYAIHEAGNDIRGMSLCLANLGAVYNYQGKYHQSIEAISKSIALHKQTVDKEKLAIAYFNMAEPQLALKRYPNTFSYLDTAMEMANEIGSKLILRESHNLKSKAYEELGEIREAWKMKELYHSYKDSIVLDANDKQVAELEARFETEAKERKINEQELLLAQQDLTINRNGWIIAFAVGSSIFIFIMAFLQRNQLKLKSKERIAEERKRAVEQQLDAVVSSVDHERRRFSEDLHDGFGQYISLITQKMHQLHDLKSVQEKEEIYHESEKILKEMGGELKNICFNLMPKTLINQGIDAALNEHLFRINNAGKVATEYISHGLAKVRLKELLEINLYRICQEWTNNIMKHSNAKKLSVQLIKHDDHVNLTIEDDGDGFDLNDFKSSEQGNGWKNIVSRINLVKGELDIDSRAGIKGTTLLLNVAITEKEQPQLMESTES